MCWIHSWKYFRVKENIGPRKHNEHRRCRKCGGVQTLVIQPTHTCMAKAHKNRWKWITGCWMQIPVFDTLEEALTSIQ
jgi:hypothetical protein